MESVQSVQKEKITVEITCEVDNDWIEFLTRYSDIFMTGYCGYWMYGMERDDALGWLCFEHDEELSVRDVAALPAYDEVVALWRSGATLPAKWYRLDKAACVKAYAEGVKRYGTDWYENGDATTYDVVVQMALLNEVVYG